ncbi:spermidine synthase, partial [Aureobasidium melanogenum]
MCVRGKEYLRSSRHAARPRPKVSCSTFRVPSGPEGSHPLARLGVQRSREMAVTFGVEDDECNVKKDNRQISDDYRHDAANSHKSLNSGSGRQVATNVQPWDATIGVDDSGSGRKIEIKAKMQGQSGPQSPQSQGTDQVFAGSEAKFCYLRHLDAVQNHHCFSYCSHRLYKTTGMSEITHPTIKDGWFREISDMWPGQAMTLKVNQVVHHEKSKYQDVLIFESTDYGMVLVLDNVIQCTERDEFSYQEMITHLAMNSHPNPKKVLVIGGGDGGVLREVVKHECVEEAVLCDIDEAVIRLSKKYLPGMAVGYQHPNVTTHVGDGFKFLDDKKGEFDVIITDSSDPEGPAEALFQKPYFELLKGALREGGVITTQAENQWLHLPLITKLKQDCKQVFPNVEYGYTTIPTYPSGQIGFMVCCLDANRNLKKPVRQWSEAEEDKLCKYYNKEIHEAAFVLPNFAKKALKVLRHVYCTLLASPRATNVQADDFRNALSHRKRLSFQLDRRVAEMGRNIQVGYSECEKAGQNACMMHPPIGSFVRIYICSRALYARRLLHVSQARWERLDGWQMP